VVLKFKEKVRTLCTHWVFIVLLYYVIAMSHFATSFSLSLQVYFYIFIYIFCISVTVHDVEKIVVVRPQNIHEPLFNKVTYWNEA